MANAERVDEPVEPDFAARLDGREQLVGGNLAPAFASLELRDRAPVPRGEGEDIGRRLDQAVGIEGLDVLLAQTLDVKGVARHEMLETLDPLRGADQSPGAAPHGIQLAADRIDLAHRMTAAGR